MNKYAKTLYKNRLNIFSEMRFVKLSGMAWHKHSYTNSFIHFKIISKWFLHEINSMHNSSSVFIQKHLLIWCFINHYTLYSNGNYVDWKLYTCFIQSFIFFFCYSFDLHCSMQCRLVFTQKKSLIEYNIESNLLQNVFFVSRALQFNFFHLLLLHHVQSIRCQSKISWNYSNYCYWTLRNR